MKNVIKYLLFILVLNATAVSAQTASIEFELNGRNTTVNSKNPFQKFFGEWTLKDDNWTHNWGGGTETIKIPDHHTVSTEINTDNSLLSIIDGPEPNGQIFWSYNPNTKEVHHLSSFGAIRAGMGKGKIDENGNIELKLVFEGEAEETYRIYNYNWLNEDEYHMKSVQYDKNDRPTGLFYEGNFVRIKGGDDKSSHSEIAAILEILDNNDITIEEQLSVYADDVIHMAPNHGTIKSKDALKNYLKEQRTFGISKMKHNIEEIEHFNELILMRGFVNGSFHPSNGGKPFEFKTKNLFVFKRVDGTLKIAKIIYNMSPKE